MRGSFRGTKKRPNVEAGELLTFLAVFLLMIALVAGKVRLYEVKEENRLLAEQLEEYEACLEELTVKAKREPSLYELAAELGLKPPKTEDIRILQIRGQ